MILSTNKDRQLKINCLYLFLLFAFLNSVLRISSESNLSLFRLFLPIIILLIACCSLRVFAWLTVSVVLLGIYSICQHLITCRFFYSSLQFNLLFYLEYLFHYSSVLVVIALVLCLKTLEGDNFSVHFQLFTTLFIKSIAIFIFVYTVIMRRALMTISSASNINNVGCMLAAGLALIFYSTQRDKRGHPLIWCFFIAFLTLYNDSKAVFLGICIEIALFIALSAYPQIVKGRIYLRIVLIIVTIAIGTVIVILSPALDGYSLLRLIVEPVQRVIHNNPFSQSNTSISFRTNSTLSAFSILFHTLGLGVGIGNTGRILKIIMNNVYTSWALSINYSLHNFWMELMCDFGWPAIILEFRIFLKELQRLLSKEIYTPEESFRAIILLSFPVWSISASGLLTEYYTLSVILFALVLDKQTISFEPLRIFKRRRSA